MLMLKARQTTGAAMSDSVCVFVVEDEALILVTIEQALQDGGFAFESAMTGTDALQLFQDHGVNRPGIVGGSNS